MPFGGGISGGGSSNVLGMGIVLSLRDGFSRTSDRIRTKYRELGAATDRVTARITRSLTRMKLGFAALAVGAALLLPLGFAVQKSMEFNAVMSDVAAKSGAAGQAMQDLRLQAFKLGEATKFSATEVGQGQAFLAMAGFNTNQILSAMPGLLSLAAAGNLDLARASDIASNVLSQFQLPATSTTRAVDVMAKTITTSNTNMEQLSQAMKFFGPTASSFGISIEEASATIGILGNNGLQGSLATRALGSSIARLTIPTKAATQMMKDYNLEFFDTKGNFVGMVGLVKQLESGFKGLTPKQKQAAITTIFQAEAIQEINALMNTQKEFMIEGKRVTLQGSAAMAQYTKELQNAGGAADELANKQLDNLKGDITILGSIMETTMIKVGAAIEPILRPLVQGLTKVVGLFGAIAGHPIGKFLIVLLGITGALVAAFGAFVLVTNLATFAAAQAGLAFISLGMTEVGLAFATGGLTAGFAALGVAIWVALAPLLPFIAIGAAVIAVGWGIYKMLQSNNEKVAKFGFVIGMVLGPVFALFTAFLTLKRAVKEFRELMAGGEMKSGFLGTLQRIGGIILGVVQIFRSWNGETFTMSENMRAALEKAGVLQFVLNLGTWVVRIKEFLKGIKNAFMSVFKPISDAWGRLKKAFEPVTEALGKFGLHIDKAGSSTEAWLNAGRMIGDVLVIPLRIVAAVIGLVIDGIALLIQGFDWLADAVVTAFNWVIDSVVGAFNFIVSLPSRMVQVGIAIVSAIKNGLVSAWDGLVDFLIGMVRALPFGDYLLDFFGVGGGDLTLAGNENSPTNPANIQQQIAELNAEKARSGTTNNTTSNNNYFPQPPPVIELDKQVVGRVVTEFQSDQNDES